MNPDFPTNSPAPDAISTATPDVSATNASDVSVSITPCAGTCRTGIVLASFGSGSAQAENALRMVEERARERFPGIPVRFAFTSPIMRERLAGQWKKSDSVPKALRKMAFEQFNRIVVQPLQLVPGVEYGEVRDDVAAAQAALPRVDIRLGAPLLDEHADMGRVAEALLHSLPAKRIAQDPVLFMGHGSRHPSETRYRALAEAMTAQDDHILLGTMKGGVRFEHLLPRLIELRNAAPDAVRRVWLLPLLSAVGRHALDDMAGSGPDSWLSRLTAEGFEPVPVLHGLMEYPACVELWLDRLHAALSFQPFPTDLPA